MLRERLGITSIEQLREALFDPRLGALPGIGLSLVLRLRRAIEREAGRASLPRQSALEIAEALAAWLHGAPATMSVTIAGSLRRGREWVGNVDMVAVSMHAGAVIDRFLAYPEMREVIARVATRASIMLRSGARANLRVSRPWAFGAALHDMTGSLAHVRAMRRRAAARGLRLTEHGVFHRRKRIGGWSEESVYAAVGLPFIPPDRREEDEPVDAGGATAGTRARRHRHRRSDRMTHGKGSPDRM